ncbi:MAG TPA: phosphoribosylformylglycinamidine cyclo-ligase [Proteobacteria bacterium]|nr:phosphoribosylformylglycinamidine cyclo-ligase [Pseudomonadota bacterium]
MKGDGKEGLTYSDAGVDIDKASSFIERIKPLVRTTFRREVKSDIGPFAAFFELDLSKYKKPILVSATDGVGTKLKVAFMANKHDTVGIDLVAMCVNDIICHGAEPLFCLDYFACGKLDPDVGYRVLSGIVEGCRQAGCALIGGETAEMPMFYPNDEYELAGFAIGVVDDDRVIDGSEIHVGQKLIGIASSGLHSNGYSLARKVIFDILGLDIDQHVGELGRTVAEELLIPTKIYARAIMTLIRDYRITGIANITGGGITDNVARILPDSTKAVIDLSSWSVQPIFGFLKRHGNISDSEMLRTFNNGIGMVFVCPEEDAENALLVLEGLGEKGFVIGEVAKRKKGEPKVDYKGRLRY